VTQRIRMLEILRVADIEVVDADQVEDAALSV
jgi:hypothetical protein